MSMNRYRGWKKYKTLNKFKDTETWVSPCFNYFIDNYPSVNKEIVKGYRMYSNDRLMAHKDPNTIFDTIDDAMNWYEKNIIN